MKYAYPAEKLSAARRCLMLPHLEGEAQSIMHAFHECELGLDGIDTTDIDNEDVKRWIAKIRELMDTSDIEDPHQRGTWIIKAEQLSSVQKFELSRAVDELAHWFDREFWGCH